MRFIGVRPSNWALVAALVVSVLVMTALPALAANSVTQTSNGNTLTATVGHSGNNFTCSGTNRRSTGASVDFILVSAVCQYRDTAGNWHDFATAPANSCSNCASVSVTYNDDPCTGPGGADLPKGTWSIRGQADGYYINNGVRHDWGDGGALHTTSPFPTASCSS